MRAGDTVDDVVTILPMCSVIVVLLMMMMMMMIRTVLDHNDFASARAYFKVLGVNINPEIPSACMPDGEV